MKLCLPLVFNKKIFLLLGAGFFAATILGTVTHECGHYLTAKYFGRNATLHYNYTMPGYDARYDYLDSMLAKYGNEIRAHSGFPGSEHYYALSAERRTRNMLITLGGPLETLLTGSIGFFILIIARKQYRSREQLKWVQWIPVFLALFWLRQLFNFCAAVSVYITTATISFRSDEAKLTAYWHLPVWSIRAATAAIAVIVVLIVSGFFVPQRQRFTLLLAGILGSLSGYWFWMDMAGPVLMP